MRSLEDILAVLHAQGSRRITLAVLEAHCTPIPDWRDGEERFPCVGLQNGVRWFYDRERRPRNPKTGAPIKALAPVGERPMLGDLSCTDALIFEGERDWLTALSLGFPHALCAGGATNVVAAQKHLLATRRKVVVCFDNDEPGIAAAEKLSANLVMLGCRDVRVARIPLAGGDFSDWAESLPEEKASVEASQLFAAGEKVGKRDARRTLQEAATKESAEPKLTDEFLTDDGDPVVLIGELSAPDKPYDETQPIRTRFLWFDRKRSAESGIMVVEPLDVYQPAVPEPADPGTPEMYTPKPHAIELPEPVRPLYGDVFQKRIVVLPSGAEAHGSSEALFDEVADFIDRYFVAQPEFILASAAYVLLTYRYMDARFEVIPYIRVVGDGGTGKTRFLRVMRELCYRSMMISGMRPVHLYRILSHLQSGVTMVLEEFNLREQTEEGREFVNLLCAGNQRNAFIPRMGGKQFSEIEYLPVFCPKVLTVKDEFSDTGLIRRCITTVSGRIPVPENKSFERLPEDFAVEGDRLRRRLLGWRFARMQAGPPPPLKRPDDIDVGIWQTWFPVLAMLPAERSHHAERILSLARMVQTDMTVTRQLRPAPMLLMAAVRCAATPEGLGSAPGTTPRAWMLQLTQDLSTHDHNGRWTFQQVRDLARNLRLTIGRSQRVRGSNEYYVAVDDAFRAAADSEGLTLDYSALEEAAAVAKTTVM